MKNVYLIFITCIFLSSCEKNDDNEEEKYNYPPLHLSYFEYMHHDVEGEYWTTCTLNFAISEINSTYNREKGHPEFGKFRIRGIRNNKCDWDLPYSEISSLLIDVERGILPTKKKYDFTNKDLEYYISYNHGVTDTSENIDFFNVYNNIIKGELIIDSLEFPEENEWKIGKIWGSYWMDLGISDKDLLHGDPNDTIHIRNGYFDMNLY